MDELLLANVYDHGWDTEQKIFEVLVAGFEESERKSSDVCRKVFARVRLELPCAAPCDGASECRSRVVAPNTIYFAFIAENCPVSQCHVLK